MRWSVEVARRSTEAKGLNDAEAAGPVEAIGVDKTFYPYNATVADEAWGSLFDFFGKYL